MLGFIIMIMIWVGVVAVFAFLINTFSKMNNYTFFGTDVLIVGALSAGRMAVNAGFVASILGMVPFIGGILSVPFYLFMVVCLVHAFPLLFGWVVAIVMGIIGNELLFALPVPMLKFYNFFTHISLDELIDYREGRVEECWDIFFLKEDLNHNPDFIKHQMDWYKNELSKQEK